jgi:hypothetical protein
MIIIDPQSLGPLWTYRLAFIAVEYLRRQGYAAFVGIPAKHGDGAMTQADVDADDWNDAVAAVQMEIGKAMRK